MIAKVLEASNSFWLLANVDLKETIQRFESWGEVSSIRRRFAAAG